MSDFGLVVLNGEGETVFDTRLLTTEQLGVISLSRGNGSFNTGVTGYEIWAVVVPFYNRDAPYLMDTHVWVDGGIIRWKSYPDNMSYMPQCKWGRYIK